MAAYFFGLGMLIRNLWSPPHPIPPTMAQRITSHLDGSVYPQIWIQYTHQGTSHSPATGLHWQQNLSPSKAAQWRLPKTRDRASCWSLRSRIWPNTSASSSSWPLWKKVVRYFLTCKNNRRIWRHNASTLPSRDVTDQLCWRHNAKSENTVLSDNGEISDR